MEWKIIDREETREIRDETTKKGKLSNTERKVELLQILMFDFTCLYRRHGSELPIPVVLDFGCRHFLVIHHGR